MPPFHLGILAMRTRKVDWLNNPRFTLTQFQFLLEEFRYAADPNDPTSTPLPVFIRGEDGNLIMVCDDYLNLIIPRGLQQDDADERCEYV
jgi:hypothetical protein